MLNACPKLEYLEVANFDFTDYHNKGILEAIKENHPSLKTVNGVPLKDL